MALTLADLIQFQPGMNGAPGLQRRGDDGGEDAFQNWVGNQGFEDLGNVRGSVFYDRNTANRTNPGSASSYIEVQPGEVGNFQGKHTEVGGRYFVPSAVYSQIMGTQNVGGMVNMPVAMALAGGAAALGGGFAGLGAAEAGAGGIGGGLATGSGGLGASSVGLGELGSGVYGTQAGLGFTTPGLESLAGSGAFGTGGTGAAFGGGGSIIGGTGGVLGTAGSAASGLGSALGSGGGSSGAGQLINGIPNNVLAGAGQAALGAVGAGQQADAYRDVANQNLALGAPYRGLLEQSYQPGFDLMSQPGYGDAFDRAADISARSWSAKAGNPAGSPTAQAGILNDVWQQNYLPTMSNYRGQLGQFGGLGLNTSGAAQLGGAQQAGGALDALGYGLGTALNQQPDWAKILGGGSQSQNPYSLNVGGVKWGG